MTVHPAHTSSTASTVRGLTLLFTALAIATAACGGADATPAKTPAGERHDKTLDEDGVSEPRTIEEAQDRIAQARAALEAPGDVKGDTRASSESAPRAEPPPAPQGGATAPAAPRQEREDACGSPCRALASMKRAVEALCRMTGDTDDRCADAKRTLGESTSRVASCKCEGR